MSLIYGRGFGTRHRSWEACELAKAATDGQMVREIIEMKKLERLGQISNKFVWACVIINKRSLVVVVRIGTPHCDDLPAKSLPRPMPDSALNFHSRCQQYWVIAEPQMGEFRSINRTK